MPKNTVSGGASYEQEAASSPGEPEAAAPAVEVVAEPEPAAEPPAEPEPAPKAAPSLSRAKDD